MILDDEKIKGYLADLPGWTYSDNKITKTFELKDFVGAMKLVSNVAQAAEQQQHHPDIDIRYNKVTFVLSTHSEGGVTGMDFVLAGEIEKAAQAV
jgi:4a-hydroxytetrahydrobiopterin dehydratase